jgi:hypothetical protein
MNRSQIGSLLSTTIIFLLAGVDASGTIHKVYEGKYISKKMCLKEAKVRQKEFREDERTKKWTKYKFHCLPFKWDGKKGQSEIFEDILHPDDPGDE